MFVLDVIPLSPGIPPGSLSYRSKDEIALGTLISVPLRRKNVPALVVGVTSVLESKAALKRASFTLRGANIASNGALSESIVKAGIRIAQYHGASLGAALSPLLTEALPASLPETFHGGAGYREQFVEDTYEKRIEAYRKLIKENMKTGGTTLIAAPTLIEVDRLVKAFADMKPVALTGAITGKKREAALASAVSASVVIATPAFAWIPVAKLSAVIIERASASGYVSPKRPYIDVRIALAYLAKERNASVAYGDLPLPLELRPKPAKRLPAHAGKVAILDATKKEGEAFLAIPLPIREALGKAIANGGHAAVLAIRKGYAPGIVCRDCKNLVKDERGAALSLSMEGGRRVLRSADGTTKLDAEAICAICGSWNLLPLGIGVERIAEELRESIPDAHIVLFDTDSIKTSAAAKRALMRMKEPGAIAVGTEVMLPYLGAAGPFDVAAIASADSLLALPFWRARERLVRAALTLQENAKELIVATRVPDDTIFIEIAAPEESSFWGDEAEMRKALSYPPYGHLLVFHAEGNASQIEKAAGEIITAIGSCPCVRLADRPVRRGNKRLSIVLKLKADEWPDEELIRNISRLPQGISLHIDPDSLW